LTRVLAILLCVAAMVADISGKWKAEFSTPDGTQPGSRASHEASGTAAGRRQIDSLQGPRLRSWAVVSDIGCSRQLSCGVTI
jgi:hypothetical protein